MKKKVPYDIAVLIVRLVYRNLPEDRADELEEWAEKNFKLFMKALRETIDEKYDPIIKKKKVTSQ